MNIGQSMHNREPFSKGDISAKRFDSLESLKAAAESFEHLRNEDLAAFLEMSLVIDYVVFVNGKAVSWSTTYGETYHINDNVDIGAQTLIVNCM